MNYNEAKAVKKRHERNLHAIKGVVAVMTTLLDGGPAIKVILTRPNAEVPSSIDGVPVIVEIRPPITPVIAKRKPQAADFRDFMWRPIHAGVGVSGYPFGGAASGIGTLGLVLFRDGSNDKFIISNAHVFVSAGYRAHQPGNWVDDDIGYIELADPTFAAPPGGSYNADIALARLTHPALASHDVLGMDVSYNWSYLEQNGSDVPVGTVVYKSGLSSGYTIGEVTADDVSTALVNGDGTYLGFWSDCYEVRAPGFMAPGDSGSSIWTADGVMIGLLFAGTGNDLAVICKTKYITQKLGTGYHFLVPKPAVTRPVPAPTEVQIPFAGFLYGPPSGERPLTVDFRDLSTGAYDLGYTRRWDFGDGTFGENVIERHTYSGSGTFHPTLKVTTGYGESLVGGDIVVTDPVPPPPIKGELSVTVSPGGAAITIRSSAGETVAAGITSWRGFLPSGSYTVLATLAGYEPATMGAEVTPGGLEILNIGLTPLAPEDGILNVTVLPAAALVRLSAGATLLYSGVGSFVRSLPGGEYLLEVSQAGYNSVSLPVSVSAGLESKVDVTLTPRSVPATPVPAFAIGLLLIALGSWVYGKGALK